MFEDIRNKVEQRIRGWADNYLSRAGKGVLLKAVALALPTYAMSCFRIPKGVCDEIYKVLARFWWSGAQGKRGVHWGAWHRLTNHKREGGLGFRELTCFNLALLGGWRLLVRPQARYAFFIALV